MGQSFVKAPACKLDTGNARSRLGQVAVCVARPHFHRVDRSAAIRHKRDSHLFRRDKKLDAVKPAAIIALGNASVLAIRPANGLIGHNGDGLLHPPLLAPDLGLPLTVNRHFKPIVFRRLAGRLPPEGDHARIRHGSLKPRFIVVADLAAPQRRSAHLDGVGLLIPICVTSCGERQSFTVQSRTKIGACNEPHEGGSRPDQLLHNRSFLFCVEEMHKILSNYPHPHKQKTTYVIS